MTFRPPRFAVLLSTYNGERFLDEQLASLRDQTAVQIDLVVSDDGSIDKTIAILSKWQAAWTKGRFEITRGPRAGFAENFRALIARTAPNADFFACCDQDDVWDPDKLTAAAAALAEFDGPVVYFSRTRLVATDGREIGMSPLFTRPASFRNALVQSIGGGNTMVLNRNGFAILAESARRASFVTHDWWAYIIVSGAGGTVIYDPKPRIAYRQHENNLVGKNTGWMARARRLVQLFRGRFWRWTTQNLDGIDRCKDLLNADALATVQIFRRVRTGFLPSRLQALVRSGVYRQTWSGQFGLLLAVLIGRI